MSLVIVAVASALINIIVFAGSFYMMLVYDSIIPSRSEETLALLFVFLILLYLLQFILESIRSDAALRFAAAVHDDLVEPVHRLATTAAVRSPRDDGNAPLVGELDAVHGYLSGPGPLALFDLPWVIPFMLILAALNLWLGLVAVAGAAILVGIAWWTARLNQAAARRASDLASHRLQAGQTEQRFAHAAKAMGFGARLTARALASEMRLREAQFQALRTTTRLGNAGRLFRLFLQSAILTVGALLVIEQQASGGIILAASILVGRALAPIDQSIAQARSMASARAGWARIMEALETTPAPPPLSVVLPEPGQRLDVRDLWAAPPGDAEPVLRGVSFSLARGESLAILGPSGAGKSTLIKVVLGLWPATRGEVRYDGATADQWDETTLGARFGYVPQEVDLLPGTLAENISRFEDAVDSDKVIAAATAVGMHERILALPGGYEYTLRTAGSNLSAGQRQRVAIARALYRNPYMLVFDEPNSNLDTAGDLALGEALTALRERGAISLIVTQRANVLDAVTHIAIMRAGRFTHFGDRETMMRQLQAENFGTAGHGRVAAAHSGPGEP